MAGRYLTSQSSGYIAAAVGGVLVGYFVGKPDFSRNKKKGKAAVEANSVYTPVQYDFSKAKEECARLVREKKEKCKSPGMSISVGVNGKVVWSEGVGLADVENNVPCTPQSMMRIASISKPITVLLLARLWDAGLIDLDAPVQKYVPMFPAKTVEGEPVEITTRMLLHHTSGVRHYKKKEEKSAEESSKSAGSGSDELSLKEYLLMKHYDSVGESLDLFSSDALLHKPGSEYLYTTHGYTLVSAVIEGAAGKPFVEQLDDMLTYLGLPRIQAERMDRLISHRSRHYQLDAEGKVVNAPYVDNSYKWAGGGLLASSDDIVEFGFRMLNACMGKPMQECQHPVDPRPCSQCAPYIKKDTVRELWTAHPVTKKPDEPNSGYGMGWVVLPERASIRRDAAVSHTGGAIGGSSALVIIPPGKKKQSIVVAMICNMENVGMQETARTIGQVFLQEAAAQDGKKTKTATQIGKKAEKP